MRLIDADELEKNIEVIQMYDDFPKWLRRCKTCIYRIYAEESEVWGKCDCEDSVMYGREIEENDVCIHHKTFMEAYSDVDS